MRSGRHLTSKVLAVLEETTAEKPANGVEPSTAMEEFSKSQLTVDPSSPDAEAYIMSHLPVSLPSPQALYTQCPGPPPLSASPRRLRFEFRVDVPVPAQSYDSLAAASLCILLPPNSPLVRLQMQCLPSTRPSTPPSIVPIPSPPQHLSPNSVSGSLPSPLPLPQPSPLPPAPPQTDVLNGIILARVEWFNIMVVPQFKHITGLTTNMPDRLTILVWLLVPLRFACQSARNIPNKTLRQGAVRRHGHLELLCGCTGEASNGSTSG
ncbi:hypothetical protein C8F01DRAFT_1092991 [Mycena amicta]|nr:hypothetical protein C8F01DRAFT_1092991 [Mycena amicta]